MLLKTIKLPKEKYRNIIFSSDGRLFASNGLNEIIVWDLYGNQQLNQFNANKYYFSHMVFSNHGKYIIIVDSHETLVLYDLISSKEIFSFQEKNIFDVAINSRLGLIAVSNSINNKIQLWDIKLNKEFGIFEDYQHSKSTVNFSPNGKILVSGDYLSGTVGLLNVASGKLTYLLKEIHSNGDLVFSPDGQIIAGESYCRDSVVLFDINSGKKLQVLEEKDNFHNAEITCIAFSSDSKLVASGSYDHTIRLWNVDTGKQIKIIEGHKTTIFNLLFIDKDRTLVSASADKTLCFWQI